VTSMLTSPTPIADGLHVLGGLIPLDGRVSWVPADARGWQPSNCYLVQEESGALLVDSGMAVDEELVIDQLTSLLGEGGETAVFFTRGEMDCVSNLGPLAQKFEITGLYTGGATNPFDAFDDVNAMRFRDRRRQIDRRNEQGDAVARSPLVNVAPGRDIAIESPLLRLLPTFWGWDAKTGTLFTSDTFTHATVDDPAGPRIVDAVDERETVESVRAHLLAKYEWLARANTSTLRDWLAAKFDELRPEAIAPTRGCVLRGRAVVEHHVRLMLSALDVRPA
jgi:glyoxylase-like metal-dependent hydrolase (beta-lactamase superfamily II)